MKTGISALLESVAGRLHVFSMAEDFWPLFERCFGSQHNKGLAEELRRQWQEGDFGLLPEVEVLPHEVLGDAMGAYTIENRTIYLSDKLLGSFPTATAVDVLLEEIGHHVDALVNREDTPGDEGEIFSYAARNVQLSEQKLSDLKTEDDLSIVNLDNVTVQVEKSGPIVLVVTTTVDEEDGSALIGTGLSLRDAVMIANGNPMRVHTIKLRAGSTYDIGAYPNNNQFEKSYLTTSGSIIIEADGATPAIIKSEAGAQNGYLLIHNQRSLTLNRVHLSNQTGRAIVNRGTFEIYESTISNSHTALINYGNSTVTRTIVRDNGYDNYYYINDNVRGGGIANFAVLNISDSEIKNNWAVRGGGVFSNGTLMISNSNISYNKARVEGGGIYTGGNNIMISNSSISYNKAGGDEGGIYISGNGGGLFIGSGNASVNASVNRSSILSNSTGGAGGGGVYRII
jgi:hypothetical protein